MHNFAYSKEWYERDYHASKNEAEPDLTPNKGEHWQRDLECVIGLGLLPEHRVLICGCAGGNNLALLAEHFPTVTNLDAFDFAANATAYCAKLFPAVRYETCCISGLPYPPRTFDRVLLMDVTEHLPLPLMVAGLYELYRVVKDGGIIAVLPGMTLLEEHINLMPIRAIAWWLCTVGFMVQPHRSWVYAKRGNRADKGRDF